MVEEFERASLRSATRNTVMGVSSGTDALRFALTAADPVRAIWS